MSDKPEFLTDKELKTCLEYLDDLRESGRTNMFDAPWYLVNEFSEGYLSKPEAYKIFAYWRVTFSERHPEVAK